jgi:hypothetical protein
MSAGMPWSHSMGVPPVRWVPELSGAVNPAWAITYAVRPEQSKPIWVPQELYWPPPRAQPLVGAGGTRAAPGGATDTAQTVNDGNASRGDPGGRARPAAPRRPQPPMPNPARNTPARRRSS